MLGDLKTFDNKRPVKLVSHPLYDNFGKPVERQEARQYLNLNPEDKILLFFGFIRKYKGLDLLLEAMADKRIQQEKIKLLVAGEFYDDEKIYKDIIQKRGIELNIILHNHFIQDTEVRYYLSACDGIVQPYRDATQSGVTPHSMLQIFHNCAET